jgi:hypothetical protein
LKRSTGNPLEKKLAEKQPPLKIVFTLLIDTSFDIPTPFHTDPP